MGVAVTDDERAELKSLVAEAVAEALAAREPRKKSRAGLLTLTEAAELIRTPVSTLRHWIYIGRLKSYRPGRVVLVRESELLALVESDETRKRRVARRMNLPSVENES